MRINIPKPCNENWNEMTPEQQGAFCKVCSKIVVDFSVMSDEEVVAYLEKQKGERTCGRFRASQLSQEFKISLKEIASQKSFRKMFAASLFIFFSSLFVCKSDTGERMFFNTTMGEPDIATVSLLADTAVKIQEPDTTVSITEADTTVVTEEYFLAGDVVAISEIEPEFQGSVADTTQISIPVQDTAEKAVIKPVDNRPMLMGIMAVEPERYVKGKVKCSSPVEKEKKQEKQKHKLKKEQIIMGRF